MISTRTKTYLAAVFLLFCTALRAAEAHRLMLRCDFSKVTEDHKVLPEVGDFQGVLIHPGDNCKVVPGRTGNAIAFDGPAQSRGQAGGIHFKAFPMDFTKPFSLIVTMRFRKDCEYKEFKEILCCCDGDRGPGFRLTCSWNSFALRGGDGNNVPHIATIPSKVPVPLGRWFRLAAVWDGQTGRIYLDGAEVASGEMSILPPKNNALDAGSFMNGFAYPLQGAMDELLIYDGALSEEDVCLDYINYLE